jgi:hypothetical protein
MSETNSQQSLTEITETADLGAREERGTSRVAVNFSLGHTKRSAIRPHRPL